MNKDRILNHSLNVIRKYLSEDIPTNNLGSGKIAGTSEAGDLPPVNLKKRRQNLFRRGQESVQQKYSS